MTETSGTPESNTPNPAPVVPRTNDDDAARKVLTAALALIPLVLWLVYVIASIAADHSADESGAVDDWLKPFGVGSGVALATIAGAWLGFKPETGVTLMQRVRLSWAGWATVAYFTSLIVAAVAFGLDTNRDNSAELVKTALATLFGFGLGALKAVTAPGK